MLSGLALALLLAQDPAPRELRVAVLEVAGSVEFKVAGKDSKWAPLEAGLRLARGTMVQTGLKSRALLKFGESTRVLVRASTFAVITEAFLERNELKGEVRVDVGSVRIDADPDRGEKLRFRVSTPQGTAAVRGTKLTLRTSQVGLEALGESGLVDVRTIYGHEYKLGMHLQSLRTSTAADLASMAEGDALSNLASDNLSRVDKNRGDESWSLAAFNPASQVNQVGHRIHEDALCGPTIVPGRNGPDTLFDCGLFYRWRMEWSTSLDAWTTVQGNSPISTAVQGSGKWDLMLHGKVAFELVETIPSVQWVLRRPQTAAFYVWTSSAQTWISQ